MKKILFSALAAIGSLFTPACSDESELLNTGNEELVTFTVSVADGLQTKAISDGSQAEWLVYEVYEANDNKKRVDRNTAQLTDGATSWTVQLHLVKEKKYDIAFWAQTEQPSTGGYYNVSDLRAVKINYASQATNDENRDAFCHIENNYVVSSTTPKTVLLKRPFAQLNFLANADHIAAAKNAGLDFTANPTAAVTVVGVADTYDVLTKKATASASNLTADFTEQTIPFASTVNSGMNGAEKHDISGTPYYYIATNYILPVDDGTGTGSTVKATLTVNGGTVSNAQTVVANAPLKPNYRTNIYGNLLTAQGTFNVQILPDFAGDKNQSYEPTTPSTPDTPAATTEEVATLDALKTALENASITTITLTADIELTSDLTISRNVTIQSASADDKKKLSGQSIIVASDKSVTFSNVNFTNGATSLQAINYSGTLKVENCEFNAVEGWGTNGFTEDGINVTTNGGTIMIMNNKFNDQTVPEAGNTPNSTYINIISATSSAVDESAILTITGNTFGKCKSMNANGTIQLSYLKADNITVGSNAFSNTSAATVYFGSDASLSVNNNTNQIPNTAEGLMRYFSSTGKNLSQQINHSGGDN